ncbi:MAG: hypothetical protein QOJ81_1720 [Chloroflexota bacterium]|jgi:hypothetical protein|nr:hypothetical protein [Chloroflexota bacterium]
MSMSWKMSTILWLVAVVLFLVAALNIINLGTISLAWVGMAAFAGGFVLQDMKM